MAKTIGLGYTDTAIGGFANLPLTLPAINWDVDHDILQDDPGECVTTSIIAPVDQPEMFRFTQRPIKDIYAGSVVDPSNYPAVRNGTSTLIELRQVYVEVDSVDVTYRKYFPMKFGLVLTLPAGVAVTTAMVIAGVNRLHAALYEKGVNTDTGVAALQRGVMRKKAF